MDKGEDTTQKRGYNSQTIIQNCQLKCHDKISNPVDFQAKTYLMTIAKQLEQVVMKIGLRVEKFIHNSILLDYEFDIQFEFDHLDPITSNLIKLNDKNNIL